METPSTSVPEYGWFTEIPEESHLKTKTQLAQAGLKPGGPIRGRVVWRRKRRIINQYDLYDEREAVPKREMSQAQRAALAKAQIALRTCKRCRRVCEKRLSDRYCEECARAIAGEAEEKRVAKFRTKALRWLTDANAAILDTETTALEGYLVQIAAIDMAGNVLLDTLINPQAQMSQEAQWIHGITPAQLQGAPTYADVHDRLTSVLHNRRVIVYNAEFDRGILTNELHRYYRAAFGAPDHSQVSPVRKAIDEWMSAIDWRCAMRLYAAYVGDWSDYWGGYRWQSLGGDHSALGDCRACLDVIKEVAYGKIAHPESEE